MKKNERMLHPSTDIQFNGSDLTESGGQISAVDLRGLLLAENSQKKRFMLHKHTYDFNGWVSILGCISEFLKGRLKLDEIRYGMERLDCHFVFTKTT